MNKLLITVTILGAIITGTSIYSTLSSIEGSQVPKHVQNAFTEWKFNHNKEYATQSEHTYRLSVFHENFQKVEAHSKTASYTLALNKFGDMSAAEFKKTYLRAKPTMPKNVRHATRTLHTVPDSKDWREDGAVNPIENQGQCGSCWAYSAVGAVEGLRSINNQVSPISLSKQQLMDCSKGTSARPNQSCEGGYMDEALQYIVDHGVMKNSDYPYLAIDRPNDCSSKYDQSSIEYQPSGYQIVEVNNELALKAAIAQGPVSVGIVADEMQFYSGGIWSWGACLDSIDDIDHGVLAVGYGEENGTKYWVIKNSWGTAYGEEGYMRMIRNDTGAGHIGECGLTQMPFRPTGSK